MAIKRVGLRPEDRIRPRGVHFPFMKRKDGLPSADIPPNIFSSNIKQILLTTFGERVMRPTFGSRLRAMMFSGLPSEFVESEVRDEVRRAITTWEPRVVITDITVVVVDTQIKVTVALFSPFGPAQTELEFKVA